MRGGKAEIFSRSFDNIANPTRSSEMFRHVGGWTRMRISEAKRGRPGGLDAVRKQNWKSKRWGECGGFEGAEESDARLSDEGKGFSLTRKGSFVTPTRKAQKKQKEVPVVGEVREGPKAEAVAVARRRREREREREEVYARVGRHGRCRTLFVAGGQQNPPSSPPLVDAPEPEPPL
jgi:hypothetical protein